MFPYLFSSSLTGARVPGTSASDAAAAAVVPLENRLEHLELACAGLWELLKTKLNSSDEELMQAIQAVDARDGVIDGHSGVAPVCPNCRRRVLARKSPKCSWCGASLVSGPFNV